VAREYLKDAPNVTVVELEIEDGWTRDWGPSASPGPFLVPEIDEMIT
jgi:agmatine/peptidylarginine deiminase